MSLVFAAIAPHPVSLVPGGNKKDAKKLDITKEAFIELEKKLIESKPDTLIIITPHGENSLSSFFLNLNPSFECNFKNYGNLNHTGEIKGDVGLSHQIREFLETRAPLTMSSQKVLDHGSSVPLCLLTKKIKELKIIPIHTTGLGNNSHFKLGKLLKQQILLHNKKIAVIASGNLSHKLTPDAPAGYSEAGKDFDNQIIKYLEENDINKIINMDHNLISDAAECGLKSILILQGILNDIKHTPEKLSYEFPLGSGYLVMNYKL